MLSYQSSCGEFIDIIIRSTCKESETYVNELIPISQPVVYKQPAGYRPPMNFEI